MLGVRTDLPPLTGTTFANRGATRLTSELPQLATKAEVAKLPTRRLPWDVMAAMVGAYTAALAAVAVLFAVLPLHHP